MPEPHLQQSIQHIYWRLVCCCSGGVSSLLLNQAVRLTSGLGHALRTMLIRLMKLNRWGLVVLRMFKLVDPALNAGDAFLENFGPSAFLSVCVFAIVGSISSLARPTNGKGPIALLTIDN